MADLSDVYGTNYQQESTDSKVNHIVNLIANNVAHRQLNFRLFDSYDLWKDEHIPSQMIQTIINKVKVINKHIYLIHLDKTSESLNMLPSLIVDSPVEYFWIIDGENHRAYFIYITPYEVNAY